MVLQFGQVAFGLGGIPFGEVDEFGVDWAIDENGFEGWGATASTRETVQRARASGGWSGKGYLTPRNLSLSGRFFAPTPELAVLALDRLNDAASIDDTLLTVTEPGRVRSLMVHRTDDVLHKWLMPTVCVWGIGLVADDPRKLHAPLMGTTRLPSSVGGLSVPFTVPLTISAVQVSGQVSLTNPGNTTGSVVLRIDGPCVGPVVTHVSSGRSLVFSSSLILGAGEWLVIDMDARSVLANGQSSRSGYVTGRGWSGFLPGENTWSFTAAGFDAGSLLTVVATPADK